MLFKVTASLNVAKADGQLSSLTLCQGLPPCPYLPGRNTSVLGPRTLLWFLSRHWHAPSLHSWSSLVFSRFLVMSSSLKAFKAIPNLYLQSIPNVYQWSPLECLTGIPNLTCLKPHLLSLPIQTSPSPPSKNFGPSSWTHPQFLFLSHATLILQEVPLA